MSYRGVPIISKVNNEDIGIFNNQRYEIIKIGTFTITIEDELKHEIQINLNDFQNSFCSLCNHNTFSTGRVNW